MKKLSWEQIDKSLEELADKIKASDFKPDYIIGITTGGLIPLYFLAKKLDINSILTVSASSYEKDKQKELEKSINNHLERIQRLENLNSKNLDYLNTDKEVLQYVSNYRGIDNEGNTLQTEVELFIKEKYGYDALTENNPFLKDNWIKTNTIFYFGTEAIDDFSVFDGRYKVVRYAFFYPLQVEYKTILGFGFDTETYDVVADNENSVKILNKLDNS